jgi:formylglycine-generating enzyme required for sulfatase activity
MKKFIMATAAMPAVLFLTTAAPATVVFDWATVGNAGNSADSTTYGAVSYDYKIAKYEVTNTQYAEFLNAVAATDSHTLFVSGGGITQNGSSGSYTYTVNSGKGNVPVTRVTWNSAARFINWMSNGQGSGDTETGVYDLSLSTPTRAVNASIFLPTENEWYKAAYYDPTKGGSGGYWTYATQSDTAPAYNVPWTVTNDAVYNGWSGPYGGGPTDVGTFSSSDSYYGTLDQSGNVWEWNETIYSPSSIHLRGGSYSDGATNISSAGSSTVSRGNLFGSVGFRVAAAVPEPGSLLVILGVGGLAMARRRRS